MNSSRSLGFEFHSHNLLISHVAGAGFGAVSLARVEKVRHL